MKAPKPRWLNSDDGDRLLLANTQGVAHEEARGELMDDEPYKIEFDGWMVETGWDMDSYESKEEFLRESGYQSWWMGCGPPADRQVTEKCMPAWRVTLL